MVKQIKRATLMLSMLNVEADVCDQVGVGEAPNFFFEQCLSGRARDHRDCVFTNSDRVAEPYAHKQTNCMWFWVLTLQVHHLA
jgi:hypothetical protein